MLLLKLCTKIGRELHSLHKGCFFACFSVIVEIFHSLVIIELFKVFHSQFVVFMSSSLSAAAELRV